jgi:hypothetical protein
MVPYDSDKAQAVRAVSRGIYGAINARYDPRRHGVPRPQESWPWLPQGEDWPWGPTHRCFQAGTFEQWICSACGFTEWYAKEMTVVNQALATLATVHDSGVTFFDGDQPMPYR